MTPDHLAAATPDRMEQAPILVATRFSFLGQSGWKSDASRDPQLLFQEDRLWRRLELFSTIALPSLAAQTHQDFHHLILTSDRLPGWAMEELNDACLLAYGDRTRFTILARPPMLARRPLRLFMQGRYPDPVVVQVVLDDDDGLATDFMADLRAQLASDGNGRADAAGSLPYFISFPEGYGFLLRDGKDEAAEIYLHRYPYINLGLAMIGTPDGKNIFAIDHRAAPRKYGGRLVPGKPMFLRTVHDFNDSRVSPTESWKALPAWRNNAALNRRFPWLFSPEAAWNAPGSDMAAG